MAGMPRESAFMPTIKCSACGNEVEISMMGEHICGGAAEEGKTLDSEAITMGLLTFWLNSASSPAAFVYRQVHG
jgi:hypothetical protein